MYRRKIPDEQDITELGIYKRKQERKKTRKQELDKEIDQESDQGKKESLDFTYVDDLVNGIILSATNEKGKNQIFNITRGKAEKLYSFVKILSKNIKNIQFRVTEKGLKKYLDFLKNFRK